MNKKLVFLLVCFIILVFNFGCIDIIDKYLKNTSVGNGSIKKDDLGFNSGEVICSNKNYSAIKDYRNVILSEESLILLGDEIRANGSKALESISDLDCLTSLDFYYEDMGITYEENSSGVNIDSISPLSKLKNLEKLNISYTNVSDLSPLFDLPKLNSLSITDTKVVDLKQIEKIKTLQHLTILDNVEKEYDFAPLKNLSDFNSIQLDKFVNVNNLSYITQIEKIYVYELTEEEIKVLSNFKNLVRLSISQPDGSISYPHLGLLKKLKFLSIAGPSNIEFVKELPELEELDLHFCTNDPSLDITPLSNNKTINDMSLLDCTVKDFSVLSSLKNLEKLTLYENEFSNLADSKFPTSLKNISVYKLKNEKDSELCTKIKKDNPQIDVSCPSDSEEEDSSESNNDLININSNPNLMTVSELVPSTMSAQELNVFFENSKNSFKNLTMDFNEILVSKVDGKENTTIVSGKTKYVIDEKLIKNKIIGDPMVLNGVSISTMMVGITEEVGENLYRFKEGFYCGIVSPSPLGLMCQDLTSYYPSFGALDFYKSDYTNYKFLGTRVINGNLSNCFDILDVNADEFYICYTVDKGAPSYIYSEFSEGSMEIFLYNYNFDKILDSEFTRPN